MVKKKIATLKKNSTIHKWRSQTRENTRKELGVSVHLSELHGCGQNTRCLSLHLYASPMMACLLKGKAKINHFKFLFVRYLVKITRKVINSLYVFF